MIQLLKKNIKIKNKIFFKINLVNLIIFFIDKIFKLSKKIKITIKNQKFFFENSSKKLFLIFIKDVLFFHKKNQLILIVNLQKNKKSILNLYNKLIKIKMKGVLQGFKLNLILKGIGFKIFVENNNLILKLGYSHNIIIPIPSNIKIINQSNHLILNSIDYISLTQFVHYIKYIVAIN